MRNIREIQSPIRGRKFKFPFHRLIGFIFIDFLLALFLFIIAYQSDSIPPESSPFDYFLNRQVIFHSIGTPCILAGILARYFLEHYLAGKTFGFLFAIVLPIVLIGSFLGVTLVILLFLVTQKNPPAISRIIANLLPTTLIIVFVYTLVVVRLDQMAARNRELEERARKKSATGNELEPSMTAGGPSVSESSPAAPGSDPADLATESDKILAVRENENYYRIPHEEILYLSSHGRRTVVHTRNRDFIAGKLLKEFEALLPAQNFLRIHKSYIVNLNAISHIQYFMGGSYLAYLKDADETNIPVGRKHAPELKKRMGII